jgi:hypothetical protein
MPTKSSFACVARRGASRCIRRQGPTTSTAHWRAPRLDSWWRVADYAAVATLLAVASTDAARLLSRACTAAWFCGVGAIATAFCANEYRYYRGALPGPNELHGAAREELFVKTVWTHLVCVHVAANALADGVFLGCLG